MPARVRMSRAKGWRKPAGVIYVGRPTRWGNPFAVGDECDVRISGAAPGGALVGAMAGAAWRDVRWYDLTIPPDHLTPALAVALYRVCIVSTVDDDGDAAADEIRSALDELRGHDLACWCPLDQPCHADVLLELANR